MDGSLSQFIATLQRRKARKEKHNGKFDKNALSYNQNENRPEYNFPDLTDNELETVKETIQNKLKLHNRTNSIISSIAFSLLVVLIYLLIS